MNSSKRILSFLIVVISITLLTACGRDKPETPSPTATVAKAVATNTPPLPTNTPLPSKTPIPSRTPIPSPTATPVPIDVTSAPELSLISDQVDSYRSTGTFITSITEPDGDVKEQSIDFEIDWVKSRGPEGGDMRMATSGLFDEGSDSPGTMELYAVGENIYVSFGDEWILRPRSEGTLTDLSSFYLNPDDLVNDLQELEWVGHENINGIESIHYTFNRTLGLNDLLGGIPTGLTGEAITTSGDVWLAEDGGYISKVAFTVGAEGVEAQDDPNQDALNDVAFTWEYELTEINSLESIELPEDVPQLGELSVPGFDDGEFPLPPDTKLDSSFGGIFNFVSSLNENEISEFFVEALGALGWSKEDSFVPIWKKGDNFLSIIITPDESGGSSILLMSEENPGS